MSASQAPSDEKFYKVDDSYPQVSTDDLKKEESNANADLFRESAAGDGTTRSDQILTGSKLILCVMACCFAMFLIALDMTITVTLLTVVANKFNSFDNVTWITSAFTLSMGCFAQVWGKLSIIFGRRWTMIASIIIFEVGSLVCALSNTMNMLIGGRALQGVGGAGIQTICFIIASEIVTIDKKPFIFSLFGATFGIASVCGPIFGGLFTEYVSWRWCFYINLCCGGVIVPIFAYSFRPKTPKGTIMHKLKAIDYFGTFTMISAIVLILLALTFGGTNFPWKSAAVICCFVLGGLITIGFCVWNFKYSDNPVLPFEIVKVRGVWAGALSSAFGYGAFMSVVQFVAIYFEVVRNDDALNSGLSMLPLIIAVVLFSIITGITMQRIRYVKPFNLLCGILMTIGSGLLVLLKVDSRSPNRIGLQMIMGIGVGVMFQPANISVQLCAPKVPGSTILSMAFLAFARNTGGAIGGQISELIYTNTLRKYLGNIQHKIPDVNVSTLIIDTSMIHTLDETTKRLVLDQFMKSIRNVFYFCIAQGAMTFLASILMSDARIPKAEKIDDEQGHHEEENDETPKSIPETV
ncbi:hypothetical protein CANARDRAFT_199507 [[Candida] arabinofermentans NRRL YB-2248]|uniref:Major facilitator superfamily (MFS) profile domain-containing protein n=1 Tax=[Candida] arabinofermentans NRRL YB-2248 TaxID=983967 RepID=A0A1E4T017_9ASCO|nr:hypothetical protein CANARDRAFT_199507 [[Candida] arabinofermentans NRRL YB-2248]